MKLQKILVFSQGVVSEHMIPEDIADQAISKFNREGYVCWKVHTPAAYDYGQD